jgi:phosphoribosylaminoimidazolecarboxamide formyltransferase/IMP cyclohydrolase
MKTALLSVYDKTGLVNLARALKSLKWEFLASGGTARYLNEAGFAVTTVEAYTRSPEILGGRVKTLHPAVAGGILARATTADEADLAKIEAGYIDLVVCNLYPFQRTISRPGVSIQDAIEQIDIGGVTLIRAAAKNFERVAVLTDPDDYASILPELLDGEELSMGTRQRLAYKAYALTSAYDLAICDYLKP